MKPEPCAAGAFKGSDKVDRINSVATRDRRTVFNKFYSSCREALFKWRNRRGQKCGVTWEQFARKLMFNPPPKGYLGCECIDVASTLSSELKHKPKSRVRKSREYGSARSSGSQGSLFT